MRHLLHYSKVILSCCGGLLWNAVLFTLLFGFCAIPLYLYELLCLWAGLNSAVVLICTVLLGYFVAYTRRHPLPEVS